MFDSVTPYYDIFNTQEENEIKRKIISKNNGFYEVEDLKDGKYKISRFNSTDPNLYLDTKNNPGQNFIE